MVEIEVLPLVNNFAQTLKDDFTNKADFLICVVVGLLYVGPAPRTGLTLTSRLPCSPLRTFY